MTRLMLQIWKYSEVKQDGFFNAQKKEINVPGNLVLLQDIIKSSLV